MKNIKELKELIDDLNQRKLYLEIQVKSVCQDKTLPLDERWELFVSSGFGIDNSFYEEFEGIDNDNFNKYELVNLIEQVRYKLYDCGFYNLSQHLKNSEFDIEKYESDFNKIKELQEEILQRWIKSYIFDW